MPRRSKPPAPDDAAQKRQRRSRSRHAGSIADYPTKQGQWWKFQIYVPRDPEKPELGEFRIIRGSATRVATLGRCLIRALTKPQQGSPDLLVRRLRMLEPTVISAWRRLQAAGGVPSPFLTWQWCTGVLSEPDTASGTSVCVVERHGAIIGLFPVEQTSVAGLQTLGPAGWQWLAPDHLDVVALPQDRSEVARATASDILSRGGVDVVDLDGLADRSALALALTGSNPRLTRRRVVHRRIEHTVTPYLSLDRRPVLRSASLRSQVGRGLRAVERAGGSFAVSTDPQDVVDRLDELMRLHVERFGEASAVFATEDRRRAHRIAARQLAFDGLARIYRLQGAEADVGLLYALRHGATLSYYSSGMRPGVFSSPGRTLLGLVAMAAAEDGLDELDLLRGDHEYKERFASGVRSDLRIRLVKATPAVGAAAARRLPAGLTLLVERLRPGPSGTS